MYVCIRCREGGTMVATVGVAARSRFTTHWRERVDRMFPNVPNVDGTRTTENPPQ